MGTETNYGAVSVAEFCKAVRISRSFFYRLRREGRGPSTFKLGRKTLIRAATADNWLQSIERARPSRKSEVGGAK